VTSALATAIGQYAARLHATAGYGHHIASPLGAWLLLALCGDSDDDELADALGMRPREAASMAGALLSEPHPALAVGTAVWHRPEADSPALRTWLAALPTGIDAGTVPTQGDLDLWTEDHTLGLIRRFPLEVTRDMVLLLASALATRVGWAVPFEVVPADRLGPASRWGHDLGSVLQTPSPAYFHSQSIVPTDRAGDVAVHTARARAGLAVTSVIADPSVPAGDVLAVAHEVAVAGARGTNVPRRSLFDLPLGEGQLWTIDEASSEAARHADGDELYRSVLPAWSAQTDIDLDRAELGFPAAAAILRRRASINGPYATRQSVLARYHRVGFEAAAATALGISTSARGRNHDVVRLAELRFGHPFAVVAVATGAGSDDSPAVWRGIPVFSAWVTEPEDA
jgi:hypothetical protein